MIESWGLLGIGFACGVMVGVVLENWARRSFSGKPDD